MLIYWFHSKKRLTSIRLASTWIFMAVRWDFPSPPTAPRGKIPASISSRSRSLLCPHCPGTGRYAQVGRSLRSFFDSNLFEPLMDSL